MWEMDRNYRTSASANVLRCMQCEGPNQNERTPSTSRRACSGMHRTPSLRMSRA